MGARGTLFVFGAIFAGAGALSLYTNVTHQIHGKPATATLLERSTQCTVEYQRVGEERRKEQWPCKRAEGFQQLVGLNKIKLFRTFIARVRFPLESDRTHEANVDELNLDSFGLSIGATLPIYYAPDNPSDVRVRMSWKQLNVALIMLAIGTPFLMLAFGIPFSALFGWAFRSRTSRAGADAMPSGHLAPTLTGASGLGDGSKSQRRPATVVTPRPSFGTRNR